MKQSRRNFLLNSSALAVAAATSSAATADNKEPSKTRRNIDYDVIVIGAGFAGVTAARELQKSGFSTLVVEGRNRLGGRTFTTTFNNKPTDVGGTWIHWSQPYIWSEVKRYDIPLVDIASTGESDFIYTIGNKTHRVPIADVWGPLDDAVSKFMAGSREVFPRPHSPFASEKYREIDGISARDRLNSLDISEVQRALVDGYFSTTGHNELSKVAWIELLRCYALSGHNLIDLNDALARFGFKNGTGELIGAMAQDSGAEIRLSTPIYRVEQEANFVRVLTEDDEVLQAKMAVITLPLNVLKDVEFSPELSSAKLAASGETHAGVGTKFHAIIKGDHGNFAASAPTTEPRAITYMFSESVEHGDTHIIGFGPSPDLLDVNDNENVQQAIRQFLPGVEVKKAFGYQWNLDPFSKGTWGIYRPGQYSRYLKQLQRNEGRLVFANSDWASGWRGFIDGAVESGLRASQLVKAALA